jgi:RNA polymerase sigma factor (sigma-70 family)
MAPSPQSDIELVRRCIGHPNDRGAVRAFLARFAPVIRQTIGWVMCRCSAARPEDREDVFQEVCVALFRNNLDALRRFDPARSCAATYLMTIARRLAINCARQRSLHVAVPVDELDGALFAEDDAAESHERREIVERSLAGCSPRDRLLYRLYFEDMAPPETIARILGVGVNTVYSKKAKLIDKLKVAVAKTEKS